MRPPPAAVRFSRPPCSSGGRRASSSHANPQENRPRAAPLSFSQQRMWFLNQWEPGAPTFNGARAIRIRGKLNFDALKTALAAVVERHESLRTIFVVHGREPRQVLPDQWTLELPVVDLTPLPLRDRAQELAHRLRELSREPFDLTKDLMIRTELLRLGEEDAVLLVRLHHIAADAFSDDILFGEVSRVYESVSAGSVPDLPELAIQYADFATWQQGRLQGKALDALVAYWTNELRGAPQLLPLPTDRPRRAIQRHEGARHELSSSTGVGRRCARAGTCRALHRVHGPARSLLHVALPAHGGGRCRRR